MTVANSSANLGFANDRATPTSEHALGTVIVANGTDYIYVTAATAQAAAATFGLTGTTTTAGSTYTHDVPAPGVPINNFFFAKKVASPF
jgi:hypothetical protein